MTCKEATRISIQNQAGQTSFAERFGWRIHLLYCHLCRRFDRQNRWIDEQLQRLHKHDQFTASEKVALKDHLDDPNTPHAGS